MLESYIRNALKGKDILLMAHIVMGYPSFEKSFEVIKAMVHAGVDLIELQIPFSEPLADGPVILRANQKALETGVTIHDCLQFVEKVTQAFQVPFLIMSYYNILFKYGLHDFVTAISNRRIVGTIVPDLPPEEGHDYFLAAKREGLSPILFFSPTTSEGRMTYIGSFSQGFIYCVARKGVTGKGTSFSEGLAQYIDRCRNVSHLPIALGFGIREKADIDFLKGKVDIAVIGTRTITIMEEEGLEAVGDFFKNVV